MPLSNKKEPIEKHTDYIYFACFLYYLNSIWISLPNPFASLLRKSKQGGIL